ncbi:MAG: hypothetical protein ABEJ24_03235 [Candidatus Magasanikbacteria bacterium]
MEKIELVIKFIKNIVGGLIIQGVLSLGVGILIFVYPELLSYLVAALLVLLGVVALVLAAKVNKFSKIEIDL